MASRRGWCRCSWRSWIARCARCMRRARRGSRWRAWPSSAGLDMRVVAPGSIPRAPGDRVKTDRRDAKRLVRLFAAGELSFAFVPSEADERFRDLVRCIEDARKDLMRARHRLSKFLLRRGQRFPGKRVDAAARALAAHACTSRTRSRRRRSSTTCARSRRSCSAAATLIGVLEEAVAESSHAPVVARLRCFRGIDTLSGCRACAPRSATFARFAKPSAAVGVPRHRAERVHLRRASACRARSPRPARRTHAGCSSRPPTTTATGPRSARASPLARPARTRASIQIAWRAQRRLHERWTHLGAGRGKPTGTVAIACARELAAFCWEAATLD